MLLDTPAVILSLSAPSLSVDTIAGDYPNLALFYPRRENIYHSKTFVVPKATILTWESEYRVPLLTVCLVLHVTTK